MQPFGWELKSSSEIRSGFAERNAGLISPSELYYHTISAHPSELGGSPWWNENGIKCSGEFKRDIFYLSNVTR